MNRIPALLCTLPALLASGQAMADSQTDTSIMLRALGSSWQYRDSLPGNDNGSGAGVAGRLISDTRGSNGLQLQLNLFQTWFDKGIAGTDVDALLLSPERSDLLETNLSDEYYAHLGIDTLRLAWHQGPLDLSVGRQPLNLATTFYFSANDIFAPYAARDFYRLYKAGVDSLRGDLALSELSSLHLYLVSGYRPDPDADTGWSRKPDSNRHSSLAHYNGVLLDYDVSIIGGRVRGDEFYGAGLQGEIGEWLGLRFEAQWRQQLEPEDDWLQSHTLGFEHRFENSLDLRLELFRNGRGTTDVGHYPQTLANNLRYPGEPLYLARHYLALGASYELTPLWIAQGLLLGNRVDDSGLLALSARYSVSDEADLTLGLSLPFGDRSRTGTPTSEFGSSARAFTVEITGYF